MVFKASQIEAKSQGNKGGETKKLSAKEAKEVLEAEKVYREGVTSVKDLIAPAVMKVDPRMLELNNNFLTTLFIINYPRYISVGWFASIVNYSSPLDISMFFYTVK